MSAISCHRRVWYDQEKNCQVVVTVRSLDSYEISVCVEIYTRYNKRGAFSAVCPLPLSHDDRI